MTPNDESGSRVPNHRNILLEGSSVTFAAARILIGLLALVLSATQPILAQPASSQLNQFEARVKEFGSALQSVPQLEANSQMQRENAVDFIVGNMLFVLLHETGHGVITELGLPVLGRQEDAADLFAALTLLKVGSPMSHRVLVEAAKGWFLSDRRAKKDGEVPVYYDEHGLDEQRAYQIVCLMVGFDPIRFADLADEVNLPKGRQKSCQKDYADASLGWEAVLKPHRRGAEEPKVKIEAVYGDGKGDLKLYARGLRSVQLLETVKDHLSAEYRFPHPFTLEMQSCGVINAVWLDTARKLTLCYELAEDFSELYRVQGMRLRRALETLQIGDQPGYVPPPEAERVAAIYQRQPVFYRTDAPPGTVIVNTADRYLYVVQGKNRALRYGIGVGRDSFQQAGLAKIVRKSEWPDWTPRPETLARQPDLPRFVAGGPGNPLGARALDLGNTTCRIHGTNQPQTIGQWVPSGCFRLINTDVVDLYDRTPVGAKVIIRQPAEN
jgi:lipoprotein-anchoring transpeptidase ErfK/SrfK